MKSYTNPIRESINQEDKLINSMNVLLLSSTDQDIFMGEPHFLVKKTDSTILFPSISDPALEVNIDDMISSLGLKVDYQTSTKLLTTLLHKDNYINLFLIENLKIDSFRQEDFLYASLTELNNNKDLLNNFGHVVLKNLNKELQNKKESMTLH